MSLFGSLSCCTLFPLCAVELAAAVSSPVTETILLFNEVRDESASLTEATAETVDFSESLAIGFVAFFSALLPIDMLLVPLEIFLKPFFICRCIICCLPTVTRYLPILFSVIPVFSVKFKRSLYCGIVSLRYFV